MFRNGGVAVTIFCLMGPAAAEMCPSPRFSVSDFRAGDEARDRGFPGGISLADADGDGDLDVFATQGYDVTTGRLAARPSSLYLNDGRARFRHAPDSALTMSALPASGSTWADIDRDGDLDALVTTQLGRTDLYFRNLGRARFQLQDLGHATSTKGSGFTSSWVDIDGDRDLDLYVGGPTLEAPQANLVFRNDDGVFRRVDPTLLDNGISNPGAVLWADVDNDGDQDLLVANSDIARKSDLAAGAVEHAVLYLNQGSWSFVRATGNGFENAAYPAVTAAFGDVDNDGDLDLFLGLFDNGKGFKRDRLFRNNGLGVFSEALDFVLREHQTLATGAAFADFNLDGNLDLIVTSDGNGISVYSGDGSGRFTPVADEVLAARLSSHWSIATGDLDGDGRLDAVIGNWGETSAGAFATLLTNKTPACGRWTEILMRDAHGAPNPPGGRVTLVTHSPDGTERKQLREASAQTGFRSQSANFFLFGVPPGETLAGAVVRWPDGRSQEVRDLRLNSRKVLTAPK